jgi:hypothetical protein
MSHHLAERIVSKPASPRPVPIAHDGPKRPARRAMRGSRIFAALLTCGFAWAVAGCGESGPETYPVTGTVMYQGQPLTAGSIMFFADEGPPSSPGKIGPEGGYSLRAVAGRHRVQIVPPTVEDPVALEPGPGGPAADAGQVASGPRIPKKYTRYRDSGIAVEVEPGEGNTIDIVLE